MDGAKRWLKDSLQLRLSLWLSAAILGAALVAGMFAFFAAFNEAHELQDDVLRQVSALFDRQHPPIPHYGDAGRITDSDEESQVIVQYLPARPSMRGRGAVDNPLALSATLGDGIQTVEVDREPYRVLVKTLGPGARIAVAQPTGLRDEIAIESALRTLTPFLVLVPILLLIVAALVRGMFRPIAALSIEIDRRGEQELHALAAAPLPTEIRPFVVAINRLLERVAQSMEIQRRFVADAAHELRSPLTALSLQAERLADADMSDGARERLGTLKWGIERGRTLLDQLLSMARAQSATTDSTTTVSLQKVYRRVLEQMMPLAEAKHVDIGVEGEADAWVLADELDLITIVKNLVDNAIRYTPMGGQIDLSVQVRSNSVGLRIDDTGPGIAVDEHQRVFDPFYRVLGSSELGSGLGLAIVKTIADRIGARVELAYARKHARTGLRVTVVWPRGGRAEANVP